eukprot:6323383-Amphidinium_carterae.1
MESVVSDAVFQEAFLCGHTSRAKGRIPISNDFALENAGMGFSGSKSSVLVHGTSTSVLMFC